MKKNLSNTTFQLFLAVISGLLIGQFAGSAVIAVILPIKYLLGQVIFFLIPFIIFGFITPSIIRLKKNASLLLGRTVLLAYISCVGVAALAAVVGYNLLPLIEIVPDTTSKKQLPEILFQLDIPPLMAVLSALLLAFMVGLSVIWTKSEKIESLLYEFQDIVFAMVKKFLLPIIPFFIAANFSVLVYQGELKSKMSVFLVIVLLSILCHILWLSLLYVSAGIYSKKNPWQVLRYYGPVALTAMGTQSSAASLGIAIEETRKSSVLKADVRDFSIPLLGNIHFPGSVLDIVLLVSAVSYLLSGTLPTVGQLMLFIPLLAIFGVAAPGLPGGTLYASIGLIQTIMGIDEAGIALMITIFVLMDSFGTTHNITGDGALSLIMSAFVEKREKTNEKVKVNRTDPI